MQMLPSNSDEWWRAVLRVSLTLFFVMPFLPIPLMWFNRSGAHRSVLHWLISTQGNLSFIFFLFYIFLPVAIILGLNRVHPNWISMLTIWEYLAVGLLMFMIWVFYAL